MTTRSRGSWEGMNASAGHQSLERLVGQEQLVPGGVGGMAVQPWGTGDRGAPGHSWMALPPSPPGLRLSCARSSSSTTLTLKCCPAGMWDTLLSSPWPCCCPGLQRVLVSGASAVPWSCHRWEHPWALQLFLTALLGPVRMSPQHHLHLSASAFLTLWPSPLCPLALRGASVASGSSEGLLVWVAWADALPQGRIGGSSGPKPVLGRAGPGGAEVIDV